MLAGWVLGVLLVGCAYAPLLRSGLSTGDYARLLGDARSAYEGPLADAWISLSAATFGVPLPGSPARALRIEGLALWLGLALATGLFVRRLLSPWIGAPSARAGAASAGLLLAVHPAATSAVASVDARGELLGLFLTSVAAALFLRGRQDERDSLLPLCVLLILLAGAASSVAALGALAIAAAEYFSARRYRRRVTRLRTAATTLAVFGAAAWLPSVVFAAHASPAADGAAATSGGIVALAVEQLGRRALPVENGVFGALGWIVAAALLVLALQPAFRAALSAPRLWGGLALGACAALLCAACRDAALAAPASARSWMPLSSTVVVAASLGITSTALAARRAYVVPLVTAAGYAALAHGHSQAWLRAGGVVADLWSQVAAARALEPGASLLVIDPPRASGGIDALGSGIRWLAHPRLQKSREAASLPFEPDGLRALSARAFLALVGEPELDALRARGLVVAAPSSAEGEHGAVTLRPPSKQSAVRSWRADLAHHFDPGLDPLDVAAVRVRAELATPELELERLGWRTREGSAGSVGARLTQEGGERVAFFDLSGSLAWRLAGQVRSLVLERGVRRIEHAELLDELPGLDGIAAPEAHGDDWRFALAAGAGAPRDAAGAFVLLQLALDDFGSSETWLEHRDGALWAAGAERFAARAAARHAPVAWTLDYRIGDDTVARSRGRRP